MLPKLPKNAARRAACGATEQSEGAKLSTKGTGVGAGGVTPPTGGGGLGGLSQENFSFENVLRVDFRLSGVHT